MKKIGTSNTLFFYTQTGDNTYWISYKYIFKNGYNLEQFKKAANDALKSYPEFSIRPIVRGNAIYALQQDVPIVFLEDDGTYLDLGSNDTNGYLFCFRYGKSYISFSFYHGLTDIKGIMTYLTDVMYRYAKASGIIFPESEEKDILSKIRLSGESIKGDEAMRLDPYNACLAIWQDCKINQMKCLISDSTAEPFDITKQCTMVEGLVRHYTIELRTADFVQKTKELKVSFIPLLHEIISSSIMKAYDTGDLPVIAMVPADMRGVFEIETLANFSDGISIPYEKSNLDGNIIDNCRQFKDVLVQHMNKEHFIGVIKEKSIRIATSQAESDSLSELIQEFGARSKGAKYTYVLTYPGKITFSESIDNMFEDIRFICRPNRITVLVYTFEDKMRFEILIRSEEETIPRCIYDGVKNHGFEALFIDNGILCSDKVNLERIFVE